MARSSTSRRSAAAAKKSAGDRRRNRMWLGGAGAAAVAVLVAVLVVLVVRAVAMPMVAAAHLVDMLARMEAAEVDHKAGAQAERVEVALLELFGDWVVTSLLMPP